MIRGINTIMDFAHDLGKAGRNLSQKPRDVQQKKYHTNSELDGI